jgi:hypothetical protein
MVMSFGFRQSAPAAAMARCTLDVMSIDFLQMMEDKMPIKQDEFYKKLKSSRQLQTLIENWKYLSWWNRQRIYYIVLWATTWQEIKKFFSSL